MTRQNMIDQELAPKDTFIDDERTSGEDDLSSPKKNVVPDDEDDDDDWVQIQDDVYSMCKFYSKRRWMWNSLVIATHKRWCVPQFFSRTGEGR